MHVEHIFQTLMGQDDPKGLRKTGPVAMLEQQTMAASQKVFEGLIYSFVDFADNYFEGAYPKLDQILDCALLGNCDWKEWKIGWKNVNSL